MRRLSGEVTSEDEHTGEVTSEAEHTGEVISDATEDCRQLHVYHQYGFCVRP